MIIRGGENVYPARSRSSHTHPAIQEVQVFGIPDALTTASRCAPGCGCGTGGLQPR